MGINVAGHDALAQEFVQFSVEAGVLRFGQFKTKAGRQSALQLKQSGFLKFGKTKYRMDSDLFYVKDKGLVKSVATMWDTTKPKEKPRVITIQETK